MSDAVKIALIALGGPLITAIASIITQLIINKKNREKRKSENEEEAKRQAVEAALKDKELKDTLTDMSKRLDEHNSYAAIFAEVKDSIVNIEKNMAVMQNDIRNLYHKGG